MLHERDELMQQHHRNPAGTTEKMARQQQQLENKLKSKTEEIQVIMSQKRELQRTVEGLRSTSTRISRLTDEIQEMKQQRVSLQRSVEQAQRQHKQELEEKRKEIQQLQRQTRQQTRQITELERSNSKSDSLLRLQMEQTAQLQKQLKDLKVSADVQRREHERYTKEDQKRIGWLEKQLKLQGRKDQQILRLEQRVQQKDQALQRMKELMKQQEQRSRRRVQLHGGRNAENEAIEKYEEEDLADSMAQAATVLREKVTGVEELEKILKDNTFSEEAVTAQLRLLAADEQTLAAADGIEASLSGFTVLRHIWPSIRVATMQDVEKIEGYFDRVDGVLAVGTGSVHDPCRLACARHNVPLCLFATAPSMDGFASYSAPIVNGNFKITYPAKCPEVIIGDTKILADAPAALKSAGFGDMISKYVALIDWQVSNLLTGESYCERVAALTRRATDQIFAMAGSVTKRDEKTAAAIFESLLLTGIAMSFTKTSRPGSGTEHIMAHFWECMELLDGKTPNYHGEDVGVTTLIMLRYYEALSRLPQVTAHPEVCNWDEIYRIYGPLAPDVQKLNTPDTITDGIAPRRIEACWPEIRRIVQSVPSYDACLAAMRQAGCKTTIGEVGKAPDFVEISFRFHPYMRRRLSLKRVSHMLDLPEPLF